jgi:hypothetical protein
MPHLLNFIESNGTLLANEHTPRIAHTANDLVTGLTGVYPDQHGLPITNSFEYYNTSSLAAYNTSAFTYWTDTVAPDPANAARTLPLQEDLKNSALPDATVDNRGDLTSLGRTFKQLNAPVGVFGKAAIDISPRRSRATPPGTARWKTS